MIKSEEQRPRRAAALNVDVAQRLDKSWCWYICQYGGKSWNSWHNRYIIQQMNCESSHIFTGRYNIFCDKAYSRESSH